MRVVVKMETCRLLFIVTVLMLSIAVSWRSVHMVNIVFFFFCMHGLEGIYRKGRNSRMGFDMFPVARV